MDQTSRCRYKIWLVLCMFFMCWYFMIHNAKWYNLSSPITTFHQHTNPMQIIDSDVKTLSETTNTNNDNDNTDNVSVKGEIDWLHDTEQMQALENDLEPVLIKIKPKQERKKKRDETAKVTQRVRNRKTRHRRKQSCNGRYIYMHDLPARFNDDILDDCRSFNKWEKMCPYVDNNGLGPKLGNPQRAFSRSGWYETNQFMLEVIFHNRMKRYECLTKDSSIASAVYVPYYAGLDVGRYLFDHNISSRDALSLDLADWLGEQPEWKKYNGKNHFLVTGRITWDFRRDVDEDEAWGNKLMLLPEFQNVTVLTLEKSPWHNNDFGIPYPTYFHPRTDGDITDWQDKMKRHRRRTLFSFAGAPRPDLEESYRDDVIQQCAESSKCRLIKCADDNSKCKQPVDVMRLFQSSVFCLQPPGDSYTRKSTFDSMLAGCIPVFFTPGSAYVQYLWHLPKEYKKYSVLIDGSNVKHKKVNIERVLSRIPARKVAEMRNEVIGLIPKLVYADANSKLEKFKDAFDLSIDGVVDRIKHVTKKNSSFDDDEKFIWEYYLFGSDKKHDWDHYFHNSKKQADDQVDETTV